MEDGSNEWIFESFEKETVINPVEVLSFLI